MFPIKVSFRAFASYVEKTEVDLEKLDRLFLINGETGAGKTAILDAITYALYGRSSGGERSEIRCALPQAADIPTEAEFIFENRGERYKFSRTIQLTPRSKKLETRQNCFYFDKEKNVFIPFFNNPTQTAVEQKAEELTGLTAEQFRQVVILPQGKFERLLTSDSKEKEAILSKLFGTEKYTAVSDKLYADADDERKAIDGEKYALDAMLSSVNVGSAEELSDEIEKLSKDTDKLSARLKDAEKAVSSSNEKLNSARMLFDRFSKLSENKNKLAELDKQAAHIEEISSRLERHNKAVKARPEYAEFSAAEKDLNVRRSALSRTEKNFSDARNRNSALKMQKSEFDRIEKETEDKKGQLTVLNGLSEVYDKTDNAEKKLSKFSDECFKYKKYRKDAENSLTDITGELDGLTKERDDITSEYSEKFPQLYSQKKDLEAARESYKDLHKFRSALKKIQDEIAGLERDIAICEKEKAAAQTEYERLKAIYLANAAAELSSKLTEGMPCPVCGSLSHPAPHKFSDETATAEQVKSARAVFEEIAEKILVLKEKAAEQSARIPNAEQCIADREKTVRETNYTPELLDSVSKKCDELQKRYDRLPQLEKRTDELTVRKEELETKLKNISEKENTAAQEKAAAEKELELLRESLADDCPDRDSYKKKVDKLKNEINSLSDKKKKYDADLAASEKELTAAETAFAQAQAEFSKAEKHLADSEKVLNEKISSLGISSVDEYTVSLLTDDKAEAYSSEKEDHERRRHTLSEMIKTLSAELEGKDVPDIKKAENDFSAAQKLFGDLSGEEKKQKARYAELTRIENEYSRRLEKYEKDLKLNNKRMEFAKTMRGDKGLSFTRFVLGIMLQLVTEEANKILSEIHGGMFRLCVKTDLMSNSKQGLDLEVENTSVSSDGGVRYGVKDLSGGEKFLISLALSLGLSAVAQSRSGGIPIEAMFIDEGFGSLDTDSLREAVNILCGISNGRELIGIISHVEELRSVIPCTITVKKSAAKGSEIIKG